MSFSIDELLSFAARSGNVELIRDRVALGANPGRSTALFEAVAHGHLPAIDALLELGADIRAVDAQGQGVLEYALRKRDEALVLHLLSLGAVLAPHSRRSWRRELDEVIRSAKGKSHVSQS